MNEVRSIRGRAVPVRGDDIDTDRIIPARFLRCVTFDGLGEKAFADDRKSAPEGAPHAFDRPEFQGASVLVVNGNFGCGSSREHAPQSLMRWGIHGVVAESCAEIFFGNCVALGVPALCLPREEIEALQSAIEADPSLEVELSIDPARVSYGGREVPASIPAGVQQAFLSGQWDSTALLTDRPEEVDALAGRLPYVSGW